MTADAIELWPDLPREKPRIINDVRARKRIVVLTILSDGEWHSGVELSQESTGGTEGLRRLRELSEMGYDIERRPTTESAWDYRWKR